MSDHKQNDNAGSVSVFESESIPKAVARMAIPTMMGMLVTMVYNLADTFFIGQTGDVSMVAAISLTMPVYPLFVALSSIFGAGGSSFISRSLGKKDAETVKKVSSFCFYGSLIAGAAFGVLLIAAMPVVLQLLGTGEQTVDYARAYMQVIAVGTPFIVLAGAMPHIVRSEGSSGESMIGMMVGTISNIILDPIFILGFGWGCAGAAAATVLGNLLAVLYFLMYFKRKKDSVLSIRPRDFAIGGGILTGVIVIGLPASVSDILMSASNLVINNIMTAYGDNAVAAQGIGMKANMVAGMLQIGLATGILPLIGYNYGAKNYEKMRRVIRFSAGCTFVIGLILSAVCMIGAEGLSRMFIDSDEVVELSARIIRSYMLSGPFIGIIFIVMNTMQAMKKPGTSLFLSLSRQGILFIPIVFLFDALWQFDGVIYAQPTADILSAVIAVVIYFFVNKKLKSEEAACSGNPVLQKA